MNYEGSKNDMNLLKLFKKVYPDQPANLSSTEVRSLSFHVS